MTDVRSLWRPTSALARSLTAGGVGVALGLTIGRPAVVVLVAPLLVAAALGLRHKPTHEPRVYPALSHVQLHEGQGTRSRLEISNGDDVEVVSRVMGEASFVALHPPDGAVSYPAGAERAIEVSPRRWGSRMIGGEKVAMTSRWAGYRWGPVVLPGREMFVLPTLTHARSMGEAPQPLGLIGAHRSRRDGDGSEFSSIRAFHSGDRLRRINWRVSLRQGTLHVESTRAEEDTAILLIVDAMADFGLSGGVGAAESSLDVTVRAAAALAEQYLLRGDRLSVRVLSPGGEYAGYRTGAAHLRRVLSLLSRVRPGIPHDVEIERIDFRATAGTVVVVLSPMLSSALASATVRLVRSGLPVIVVDPLARGVTPMVWPDGDESIGALAWRMRLLDRDHLLASLAAVGCPVVPWEGPRTLEEVLRRLARRAQLPRVGGG